MEHHYVRQFLPLNHSISKFPTTEPFALKELYLLLDEGRWSLEWISGNKFTYDTNPNTPHYHGYIHITNSKDTTKLDKNTTCNPPLSCPLVEIAETDVSTTYSNIKSLYIPYYRDKPVTYKDNLWFFYLDIILTGNYLETMDLLKVDQT